MVCEGHRLIELGWFPEAGEQENKEATRHNAQGSQSTHPMTNETRPKTGPKENEPITIHTKTYTII